jgi:hypothetical protein
VINKHVHHGNGVTVLNPHLVQVNVAPPNHIQINVSNHAKIIVGPTMIILVIKLPQKIKLLVNVTKKLYQLKKEKVVHVGLMIVGVTKLPLKRNQQKLTHLPPNNQEVIQVMGNNHLNPKRRVSFSVKTVRGLAMEHYQLILGRLSKLLKNIKKLFLTSYRKLQKLNVVAVNQKVILLKELQEFTM